MQNDLEVDLSKGRIKELMIEREENMNREVDVLKSLGFSTEPRSLIDQGQDRYAELINKGYAQGEQSGRVGQQGNAHDRLMATLSENHAVSKSLAQFGISKAYGSENLKDTHGEQFHTDNDKTVEREVSTIDEVDPAHDADKIELKKVEKKAAEKSFSREELFLKALGEIVPQHAVEDQEPQVKPPHKKQHAMEEGKGGKKPPMAQTTSKPAWDATKLDKDKAEKSMGDLDDLVKSLRPPKACKAAPKQDQLIEMVDDKPVEDFKDLHENSPQLAEKKRPAPVVKSQGFIKSVGPGGVIFDFGAMTGNPIADHATQLLNQHGDKVQMETAQMQRAQYDGALKNYVTKGEHAHQGTFGEQDRGWNEQMNKPMDQQVQEAFDKGVFTNSQKPEGVVKSEMQFNGETLTAMSETDAAVLEMFKSEQAAMNTEGMNIADVSNGGAQSVTVDCTTK